MKERKREAEVNISEIKRERMSEGGRKKGKGKKEGTKAI